MLIQIHGFINKLRLSCLRLDKLPRHLSKLVCLHVTASLSGTGPVSTTPGPGGVSGLLLKSLLLLPGPAPFNNTLTNKNDDETENRPCVTTAVSRPRPGERLRYDGVPECTFTSGETNVHTRPQRRGLSAPES